ncbi:class E sortase [Lentzea sp. NPDC059081]|uniref:class E sortase n=1 Tax=Lentzea sp. NPDC059081 TaxID=3346719 RepID=UPI003694F468
MASRRVVRGRDVVIGPRRPSGGAVVSELAVTAGLVLALLAAWEVWGKAEQYSRQQDRVDDLLARQWDDPAPAPPPAEGAPFSRLRIPRLGLEWTVVEGVTPADLRTGPGHYPVTQEPGEKGNFAVAGHRSPGVFWDLDLLRPDDLLEVETRTRWFDYRVSAVLVVRPGAVGVLAPVPGEPGATPSWASITLTTCNPKWDNYQRLVVHGRLADSRPKTEG